MSAIYVTTQGATVQRRSGQFLVCKDSSILQNVPETHVKQLILFGNVNLTTPAVAFCLDQRVDVVFLTQGGRFRGRLNGDGGKSAEFRLFASCVPSPWRFEKRTAHPPLDEVNAMLSLSYTLLYNRMASHLNMIGLDSYQGFFHQARHGHAALASDLIEEFRPLIAD